MSERICFLCYANVVNVNNDLLTLPTMTKLVTNCSNHLSSTLFPATHSLGEIDANDLSLCERCLESATNLSDLVEELESCKKDVSNSVNQLSNDIWQRKFNECCNSEQAPDLASNSAAGENEIMVNTTGDPLEENEATTVDTVDNGASVVNEQLSNSGRSRSRSDLTESGSLDQTSSILSEDISSNGRIVSDASDTPKHSHDDVGNLTNREKIKRQTFELKNYLKDERTLKKERNRRFKCLHCSRVLCSAWQLKIHIRIHTGKKQFKCLYCEKTLNSSSGLNEHLRIHTGEKPYKCSTCGKEFAILSSKRRHQKLHTGEKAYKCTFCGKKFNRMDNMKSHMRHELQKH